MERLHAMTHFDPVMLARMVNSYLDEITSQGRSLVSITITTDPWADDGAAGTNYTAFVLTGVDVY